MVRPSLGTRPIEKIAAVFSNSDPNRGGRLQALLPPPACSTQRFEDFSEFAFASPGTRALLCGSPSPHEHSIPSQSAAVFAHPDSRRPTGTDLLDRNALELLRPLSPTPLVLWLVFALHEPVPERHVP